MDLSAQQEIANRPKEKIRGGLGSGCYGGHGEQTLVVPDDSTEFTLDVPVDLRALLFTEKLEDGQKVFPATREAIKRQVIHRNLKPPFRMYQRKTRSAQSCPMRLHHSRLTGVPLFRRN